jgi:mannose-6-phosphate isomerase-like protein (cupin superfamily)
MVGGPQSYLGADMNEVTATVKSIEALQAVMRDLPQATLSTEHHFADGMYCRALFRPADTLIVGKVHKREHFYMVLSGEVTVISDGIKERVKAPRIFVSKPGTKRAVYAHEDSLCITVHRTDKTDLDEIEAELLEPDETAMFDAHNELKLKELT